MAKKKNKKPENRWKRKKGKDRVDSEKIGIYKTPVRPIKQRPIPSGDRDGSRQTCSVKTASRQLTGNWCTGRLQLRKIGRGGGFMFT